MWTLAFPDMARGLNRAKEEKNKNKHPKVNLPKEEEKKKKNPKP